MFALTRRLKYSLHILQLEGYQLPRFFRWLQTHIWQLGSLEGEPKWTSKAKQLYYLTFIIYFVFCVGVGFFSHSWLMFIACAFLLGFNPYIALACAVLLIRPYEVINRLRVKRIISNKIDYCRRTNALQVIGITGSYGKTSTKQILGKLLPQSLTTPKSFNTLFGIYNIVHYELNKRYKYFILEMGAYKRGDVKEFCQLSKPNIVLLTGINEQHLERFGNINNTIQAKFEILTGLSPKGLAVVNLDNDYIRNNLAPFAAAIKDKDCSLIGYTTKDYKSVYCDDIIPLSKYERKEGSSCFSIVFRGKEYNFQTSLAGKAHLSNLTGALSICLSLGEEVNELQKRVAAIKPPEHRMQLRQQNGLTIIDDTYSSNPTGFIEALNFLSSFEGKKVLITPGIVELGKETALIHQRLGQAAAKICDEIILVGNSQNLQHLSQGASSAGFSSDKIIYLPDKKQLPQLLLSKSNHQEIILLENDLPDQYA